MKKTFKSLAGYTLGYDVGLYNNRPASRDFYKGILFVFTDISPKRLGVKDPTNYNRYGGKRNVKIIFVTNKQLMDKDFKYANSRALEDARTIVMDSKEGTRFEFRGEKVYGSGSYLHALFSGATKIKAVPYRKFIYKLKNKTK